MATDHNVQSWDLLRQLNIPLVPAGNIDGHLDHDELSPVSKPDDYVDPLSFKPCHLFGDWLQLVLDDEGARVGHLDGDDHDGDDVKGGHLQGLWGEVANDSHFPTSNLDPEKHYLLLITTEASNQMTSLVLNFDPIKSTWSGLLIKIKEISQGQLNHIQ